MLCMGLRGVVRKPVGATEKKILERLAHLNQSVSHSISFYKRLLFRYFTTTTQISLIQHAKYNHVL